MPPTPDEFEAWRDSPVTRWVFAACRLAAEDNKTAWVEKAWAAGTYDRDGLLECRTRADAYLALCDTSYADWLAANGDDIDQS